MSRIVLALGLICVCAGWNPPANAQPPYYGSGYSQGHPGHHHHYQSPHPGYGANYGYTPPAMFQPAPSFGGYGPGYANSPGYGMGGGYPNAGYYPAQPNSGHHHHHHQPMYQPPYQPPYQPTYPAPHSSHPWHLGHFLLGT